MLQNKATYVYLIMVGLVIFSFGCNSSKQPQPYYVSGQVLDNDSGIEGVTINFSGGHESVTTSKNGVWSKSGLTGEVTITPSKEGMSFSPPSVTVNTETHGIRFKRVETRYEASGTVKDQNGQGIADVELHFNPVGLLAKTDANGNWSRDGLFGKVTIIPNKLNYRFEPSNIEISEVTHNITFTGIYDDGIPSVPIGLSATLTEDSTAYNIHLKLTWNANPEDDIARYYVWYRSDEEQYFKILRIVDGKTTSYIHKDVTKDKKRWYTISAENARGYQSDKCPPISVIPAELIPILPPPAAPTWGDSPLKTGADDEGPYSCWIELEWNEVNTRRDGSPLEDLLYYSIYTINPTDYGKTVLRHVDDVPAGSNTYRLNGLTRGATYTFVVKAVDKWKNESALSEERSIIAGGPVPKAPTLLSVNNIDNSNVEIVFSAVTENTAESSGGPVTIGEYVIYRSLNAPLNFIEIGRVKAQNPQPEQYSYIDSTVVRGDRYFYSIKAINTNFNYSD
ncbi:MAG: hypothetical protein GX094_06940, partial [Clostridiales bacterium]|nr:hypothetical protein [Clostridiales bacterium]